MHGHLGLMNASFLNVERTSDWAVYAGLDMGLSHNARFIIEGRSKTSADHAVPSAVGFVFSFGERMTLGISLTNDGAGHKHGLSIGAGYNVATTD